MTERLPARAGQKLPTYADRAEKLLFELKELAVGQPAPPLVGRDSDGKEFRLADCKGNVVVLMFSANWCGPCKAVYPTLRGLQKKFDGKPVQVVTVMADSEVKTVRAAIARGDITWRAVWDGARGPIASKWNVWKFPTLYVFDQRGIVRSRDTTDAGELESLVARLLKEAR
jgi:thiol-disulfide isomerase/thioredoxin